MDAGLRRPGYDPATCTTGVVHVGVGSFHRAHQAVFFDDLLHQAGNEDWAVAGVNLLPQGSDLLAALAARGNRYVLKTVTPEGQATHREIASLRELVDHPADPVQAASLLARAEVGLVTMTVTETGYMLDKHGRLDTDGVVGDEIDGGQVTTIYGYLRAGLNQRRAAAAGKVTLLCCDNLRANGKHLQTGLEQYLQACGDTALADWLAANASFPCCMVDRITPVPDPRDAAEVSARFGIAADPTVMAEDHLQWVVEDRFAGRRPPLDSVGAELCADVEPYEEAKVRVLNGGHAALAFQAALRGMTHFDEAVRDPELGAFLDAFIATEVIPGLGGGGPVDLPAYAAAVRRRFGNSHLRDTVARICLYGAEKMGLFIMPTVAATLERGEMPHHALQVIASWRRFLRAVTSGHLAVHHEEPLLEMVAPLLADGTARQFATAARLWGDVPARHPAFADTLEKLVAQ